MFKQIILQKTSRKVSISFLRYANKDEIGLGIHVSQIEKPYENHDGSFFKKKRVSLKFLRNIVEIDITWLSK